MAMIDVEAMINNKFSPDIKTKKKTTKYRSNNQLFNERQFLPDNIFNNNEQEDFDTNNRYNNDNQKYKGKSSKKIAHRTIKENPQNNLVNAIQKYIFNNEHKDSNKSKIYSNYLEAINESNANNNSNNSMGEGQAIKYERFNRQFEKCKKNNLSNSNICYASPKSHSSKKKCHGINIIQVNNKVKYVDEIPLKNIKSVNSEQNLQYSMLKPQNSEGSFLNNGLLLSHNNNNNNNNNNSNHNKYQSNFDVNKASKFKNMKELYLNDFNNDDINNDNMLPRKNKIGSIIEKHANTKSSHKKKIIESETGKLNNRVKFINENLVNGNINSSKKFFFENKISNFPPDYNNTDNKCNIRNKCRMISEKKIEKGVNSLSKKKRIIKIKKYCSSNEIPFDFNKLKSNESKKINDELFNNKGNNNLQRENTPNNKNINILYSNNSNNDKPDNLYSSNDNNNADNKNVEDNHDDANILSVNNQNCQNSQLNQSLNSQSNPENQNNEINEVYKNKNTTKNYKGQNVYYNNYYDNSNNISNIIGNNPNHRFNENLIQVDYCLRMEIIDKKENEENNDNEKEIKFTSKWYPVSNFQISRINRLTITNNNEIKIKKKKKFLGCL